MFTKKDIEDMKRHLDEYEKNPATFELAKVYYMDIIKRVIKIHG
jgi:poly-beta-hydroxyalkanoate depolymerase